MATQTDFEPALSRLRAAGLLPTFERLAVLTALKEAERPQGIPDLVTRLADADRPLSWEGVERTLASLAKAGLVDWDAGAQGPEGRLGPPLVPEAANDEAPARAVGDPGRACPALKALGHPERMRILCHLCDGARCVMEVVSDLGISQSMVSQHLSLLRRHDLVTATRDGGRTIYKVAPRARPALKLARTLAG